METKQKKRINKLLIAKREEDIRRLDGMIETLNGEISDYLVRCAIIGQKIDELGKASEEDHSVFTTPEGETREDLNQILSIIKDYVLPRKAKQRSRLVRKYYNLLSKNQKAMAQSGEFAENQPGQE